MKNFTSRSITYFWYLVPDLWHTGGGALQGFCTQSDNGRDPATTRQSGH